jgi:hypothetical protein
LLYLDTRDGVSNIWSQPLAGGRPTQATKFSEGLIHRFAYSRDGKQLAVVRPFDSSAAVLIRNFN